MSCWENPEVCRGCPYCVGGEDDCGWCYYSDFTPVQARRVELGLPPGEPWPATEKKQEKAS